MSEDHPGGPSRWRYLGIVVPQLDVRIGWRRHRRTMSDAELAVCRSMLGRLPGAVAAWSEGNASLDPVDIVTAHRPVDRLSRVGHGWWLDPDAARPVVEAAVRAAGHVDSVVVLYPSSGDPGLTGAWGYTWGRVGRLRGPGSPRSSRTRGPAGPR
jgi:hypothetical protein